MIARDPRRRRNTKDLMQVDELLYRTRGSYRCEYCSPVRLTDEICTRNHRRPKAAALLAHCTLLTVVRDGLGGWGKVATAGIDVRLTDQTLSCAARAFVAT